MKKKIVEEFEKYDWCLDYEIVETSKKLYSIKFPKCYIEFYINNMYNSIECFIYVNKSEYSLRQALMFNNKKTGYILNNHSSENIEEYIKQYVFILNSELLKYINDDFHWCKRADKSLGLNS